MAISTPTIATSGQSTSSLDTLPLPAFTPSGNALLVAIAVIAGSNNSTKQPSSISDTFSPSLTWTKQVEEEVLSASNSANVVIWTAVTPASPGSGTVTFTFAATSNRNSAAVVEVASGFDATNPVAQVGKNGGDNISSLTVTLPGTPAASSLIITGLAGRNGGSATPPDGYVNLGANTGGTSVRRIDYGPGSAGGTIQFTDIDAVTDRPVAAAAIEIVEPSSGAQTIEPSAIAGGATVYQPSILPGAVSISPNFVDEGSQVYAPSLGVTIEPSAITSDAELYQPSILPGGVTIEPSAIAGGVTIYQPVVGAPIVPSFLSSGAVVYQPSILPGNVTVSASAIASGAVVYQPRVRLFAAEPADGRMVVVRAEDRSFIPEVEGRLLTVRFEYRTFTVEG